MKFLDFLNSEPKKEDLTVRMVANALKILHEEQLEKEKLEKNIVDRGEITNYYYRLDENIIIDISINNSLQSVKSCSIILTNQPESSHLFYLKKELLSEESDKVIKWRKNKYWYQVVKEKIRDIFNTYYEKKEEERRKKEEALRYFNKKFENQNIPEQELVLNYQRMYWDLERAESVGLVVQDEVLVKGYKAKRFKSGVFTVVMTSYNDSNITLMLEEKEHQHIIYYGDFSVQNGNFSLEKNKIAYEFWLFLKELPEKTKEKKEVLEQEALTYFTKKYRIKSLKY